MTKRIPAGLVAVKGHGAPSNDMPAGVANIVKATATGADPRNFRVSSTLLREFKTYAAAHDLKLNELLVKCFESFRKHRGD
jgi:hypothetical protein